MERLTTRIADTVGMAWEHEEMHTMDEWVDMLQTRLCEYEDTGWTPDEIKRLATVNLEPLIQLLVDTVPQLVQAIVANLPQALEAAVNKAAKEIEEGQP